MHISYCGVVLGLTYQSDCETTTARPWLALSGCPQTNSTVKDQGCSLQEQACSKIDNSYVLKKEVGYALTPWIKPCHTLL